VSGAEKGLFFYNQGEIRKNQSDRNDKGAQREVQTEIVYRGRKEAKR